MTLQLRCIHSIWRRCLPGGFLQLQSGKQRCFYRFFKCKGLLRISNIMLTQYRCQNCGTLDSMYPLPIPSWRGKNTNKKRPDPVQPTLSICQQQDSGFTNTTFFCSDLTENPPHQHSLHSTPPPAQHSYSCCRKC